jgi:hypothetical protein
LHLTHSNHVTIRNLNIDFDPLPFADGLVAAVNAKDRYLDVQLFAEEQVPLVGGPTKQDGEQAFFGMLWHDGPYSVLSRHYWIDRIAPGPWKTWNCGLRRGWGFG